MWPQTKLALGTLSRLTAAGGAAWLAAHFTGSADLAALGAAVGNVAMAYLTNRSNMVEEATAMELRGSKNHHLQIALAGAFRLALENLQALHPDHQALFEKWQFVLEKALDEPTRFLPVAIPAEFDPLLAGTNPYAAGDSHAAAFAEAELLLRFWSGYREDSISPSLPALPADLRAAFETEFLPAFQDAFGRLLIGDQLAFRAFTRRSLQKIEANTGYLVSRTRLPLVALRPPVVTPGESELNVLLAERRAIPVVGRESDLVALHAWLESPAPVSVRIVTGPAGAGKTRLAIQLLEDLARSNWDAGFLRDAGLAKASECDWRQPTLAVIDYAAASAPALKTWLAHLADLAPAHKLRVLLLERDANVESGWLGTLLDRLGEGRRIAALIPESPVRVTPLGEGASRRQVLEATLAVLGVKAELPVAGRDEIFDKRLAEPLWQDPLYLMMAALVARHGGGLPQALALSRSDLAFRLADRELDRIARFLPAGAANESALLLKRLAGVVTACRSVELADLRAAAKEEGAAMGIEFPGGSRIAAERVAVAMARQGKTAGIEPDIIGEAAMARVFGGDDAAEGSEALVRAARRSGRKYAGNVCFAVTRTCQDFAGEACQEPLDWVEALIRTGESEDLTLLMDLEDQMPRDTLILRERAARVDGILFERYRAMGQSAANEAVLGRLANNLANRLRDLGRREEALAMAEEAVRIRRQLTQARPDAFLPGLGMSVNNLATMLSDLGRREEALAMAEEAVRIRRQLAQARPDAFLPDLGMSVNNLAKMLSDLGRREEALAMAEEAVRIRRQLAQARPDAFLPGLGTSVNNLAAMLSALGQREEALAMAEEAVRIRRQLAQARPDAFLPVLGVSVSNLANRLSALGRREESLARAEEAVRIYRQLAQARPDAFLPDQGMSMNNLAAMLSDLGRPEEALAMAEEAVRIYRQLAQARPDAFLPDLGMSVNNLANRLSALGRREEALAMAEEAVRIYRELAHARPDAFLPGLGMSVNNLATMLRDLGQREEALAMAEEAVRIRRQLAQARPDAFLPDLSKSLAVRGLALGEERGGEAMASFAEAVRVLTPLCLRLPQAHLPLMRALLRAYLRAAERAGAEPDPELLAPLLEALSGDADAVT